MSLIFGLRRPALADCFVTRGILPRLTSNTLVAMMARFKKLGNSHQRAPIIMPRIVDVEPERPVYEFEFEDQNLNCSRRLDLRLRFEDRLPESFFWLLPSLGSNTGKYSLGTLSVRDILEKLSDLGTTTQRSPIQVALGFTQGDARADRLLSLPILFSVEPLNDGDLIGADVKLFWASTTALVA